MPWTRRFSQMQKQFQTALLDWLGDLSLLADGSQLNRRTRLAWSQGRTARACYLLADHQRRRITRRREIRRLVES